MLLGREEADPTVTNTKWDETPLSGAAGRRHEEIIKILLGKGGVNLIGKQTAQGTTLAGYKKKVHKREL